MGEGKRCRDAMRAAGSAFTSPGISILLEVMVAGRGVAGPQRGLCGLCARSEAGGRARLYIGRCQAEAFLIGREGRGAGAGPSYLRRLGTAAIYIKHATRAACRDAGRPRSSAPGVPLPLAPGNRPTPTLLPLSSTAEAQIAVATRGSPSATGITPAESASAGGAPWPMAGAGRGPGSLAVGGWRGTRAAGR